jgi:hypothetical protein
MAAMKFDPGQIVATRGAVEAFVASGDSPYAYLLRHVAGDWGGNLASGTARKRNLSQTKNVGRFDVSVNDSF